MRPLLLSCAILLAGCPAPSSAQKPTSADRAGEAPVRAAPRPRVTDPSAEDYEAPPLPTARVVLVDAFGTPHRVDVEVANTPPSRQRGMMWRKELAAGKGMLFIFPYEGVQSFWMVNTLIPLDMIFIDDTSRVVGVVSNATPLTRDPRSVGIPSRYVLEVPGGWSEANGIAAGASVRFEGTSTIPVR